jgi:Dienelactone hydrolase and related enzymes
MKIQTLLAAALLGLAGSALHAQDVAGDWQGTLKADGVELRLALHITKSADGSLGATLDSIDQGAKGIPAGSVTLRDSKLSFTVSTVNGSYEGKVNAAANVIDGIWTQGQSLALAFRRAAAPDKTERKPAMPSDIDGTWLGMIDAGVAKLRIVFHIVNTEDRLTATMDSPDQGARGIPVTSVARNGSTFKLEVRPIGSAFEGKISADLSTIGGTWTQGGRGLPLMLKRVKDGAELERRRPQTPVKPYPYREEEVAYDSKAAGIRFGATLTIPQGKGPFPAVALITGSGQQDRDESLFGHRPFLVLADYLTRKGIATLRADDRGIGNSGGDFTLATTADFAIDAEAGIAYLKTRSEVNPRKLGLIGHSEGGGVAALVAARNPDVAFVVMMAGPGVRGGELLPAQVAALMEASGRSRQEADQRAAEEREILALVGRENGDGVIEKKLRELTAGKIPDGQLSLQLKQLRSPWFQYFLEFDPSVALQKMKCPVLALIGEKDRQVPPGQNLPAIRKALEAGDNQRFKAEELPGLNHLFQTAKTGLPGEYAEIEETMAPVVLEKVSSWILKQ